MYPSYQRVLLTGATGFVGSFVARLLARTGVPMRLLVRTGSDTSHLDWVEHHDVLLVEGDLLEPTTLAAACHGCDAVVHCAGNTSLAPNDHLEVWRTNVDGTLNLLNAAVDAGVRRVVYTSSVSAVGSTTSATRILDERTRWSAGRRVSCYVRSKYRAEREAISLGARGLELVILNPSVIAGPGDPRPGGTLLAAVRGRLPAILRTGGVGVVDVRDVALGHLRALHDGEPGRRYILSAENRTLAELFEQLCGLAGVEPPRVLPLGLAKMAAAVNERIVARVDRSAARRFNRELVDDASRYWFVDNTRSRVELGIRYRPLRETLVDTLRWALHTGALEPDTPQLSVLSQDAAIDLAEEATALLALDAPELELRA